VGTSPTVFYRKKIPIYTVFKQIVGNDQGVHTFKSHMSQTLKLKMLDNKTSKTESTVSKHDASGNNCVSQ